MEFRILGPVEVSHAGRVLPLGRSRERSVLAVLLLSLNRVVSVERLVDDLWGDEPPEGAVQTLRVFVSRLRKLLREGGGEDGTIVTEPAGYVARVDPTRVDATRFEALVAAGRDQARRGDHHQAATTLGEALALWRGPALVDVTESPLARAAAARLEELRLAALEERIEADLACGRHSELVAELDTLTRAHPLRERLWGQWMVALYRSGRQADALRAYQDVRRILGEELGLEPSGGLAELEGAILRHDASLDLAGSTASVVEPPGMRFARRTPYVGRETERAELSRLFQSARHGDGSLVLIAGEPGVGKTRLTEEIGAEATRRGMPVLIGRCYETEGAPPYVAFVEVLEQLLARAPSPAVFLEALGEDAPEVAKLLPHLRRLFPDLAAPLQLPPEQERRYLFNCLRDCFAREAAAQPLLLILDDLHWADGPTLLFLEHLAEGIPTLPLLAVGTYRDTEVATSHRLTLTLDRLLRARLAQRMGLRRLSEETVAALLAALGGGQEPPASLVKVIYRETEGNPFFVEEVFKHLAEEGRLFGTDGRFQPEITVGSVDVPETVRIVLGRRLERLTEDGRKALSAAAVVGRAFTFELLEALGEVESAALLDAIEEAERARLITPVTEEAGEDRLLFSHELIRQTLLTGLSQPRRQRLHLLVADMLERLQADTLDEWASEIAHHLTRAGPVAARPRLLTYLTRAGRWAMRTAGYEEALRYFEQAVAMAEVAEPAGRPELFVDRALARRSLGRYEDALPDWEEALSRYEALGDPEAAAGVCFEASLDLWWLNRDREALSFAERGLAALAGAETPQRARMLAWTGVAGAWVSPYEHGAEMIDEALSLAERLADQRLAGYALVNRALHRFAFSLHEEVLEAGREGTRLLRAEGGLWEVATLLAFMEVAAVELGRLDLAAELGEEVDRLATRLGHSFALFVLHEPARSARQFLSAPNFDDLEASARRHLEVAGPIGFRHHSGTLLAHVAFLRGNWNEALRLAEEAVRYSPEHHSTSGPDWGCYLRLLAYCGRAADVVAVLDRRRGNLPEVGRPNGYGSWCEAWGAIEALSVIGEHDRAASLYPLVQEFRATTGVVLPFFSPYLLERIAGIAAASGRCWDAAEEHFRRALGQAEELPFVVEGAETRRCYGQMLLQRAAPGDQQRACILLGGAVKEYRRLGMPRHVDLSEALLAQVR